MADRLVSDGAEQDGGHLLEVAPAAERRADVDPAAVRQAEMEPPVGGETHAVAGPAIRFRDRADKPDDAARARQAMVARLVGRIAAGQRGQWAERLLDARTGLGAADEAAARHLLRIPGPERHGLDKAHVPRALEREGRQRNGVLLVEAAYQDRVQLDRYETRLLGRLDAGPDVCKRAPAHDLRDARGIEAVEVHV